METMLMLFRRATPWLVLAGVLPLFLVSCAKRPAVIETAPAPTVSSTGAQTSLGPTTGVPSPRVTAATPGAGSPALASRGPVSAATQPPAPKEFTAIKDLKPIYFDFDKYDIRSGDAKILDENARWMKANPNYLVLVEGHCDERGTDEYNLALGERRAKATVSYLVSQGVAATRMTLISYGEERPVCREKNEECWAKNRRAHFLVKPR